MNSGVMGCGRFVVVAVCFLAALVALAACAPGMENSAAGAGHEDVSPSATVAIPTMSLTAVLIDVGDHLTTVTPPATVTAAPTIEVIVTETPSPTDTPQPTNTATPLPTVRATLTSISEPERVMNDEVSRDVPEHLQGLVDEILADVFGRTQAPTSAITIRSIESVTWNDGSLGCPEPDMMYTMAIVEGYRIVIDAAGMQLAYHTGRNQSFKYCANAAPPVDKR